MSAQLRGLWYWMSVYAGPILIGFAVVVLALIALVIWQQTHLNKLRHHYQALTKGVDTGNLQTLLESHMGQMRDALGKVESMEALVRELQRAGGHHLQQCGVVRFDALPDTGGEQSFALSLTDGGGYGAVISSLHYRDNTRVFSKPLAAWESPYPLSEEEQQAIAIGREMS